MRQHQPWRRPAGQSISGGFASKQALRRTQSITRRKRREARAAGLFLHQNRVPLTCQGEAGASWRFDLSRLACEAAAASGSC